MTRECMICGKEFETNHGTKKFCSKECAAINHRQVAKDWYRIHGKVYRKQSNGIVLCRICGEPIYRNVGIRSTSIMHDECVFKQCKDVLQAGEKLSTAQIQRLSARGYTQKEFIEEYISNE